jgi:hypothetical protein
VNNERSRSRSETDMKVDPCNDPQKYAPVLGRMVELLGAPGSQQLTFGQALLRASKELRITVPTYMNGALIMAAFKVIAGGKIPGLPEA